MSASASPVPIVRLKFFRAIGPQAQRGHFVIKLDIFRLQRLELLLSEFLGKIDTSRILVRIIWIDRQSDLRERNVQLDPAIPEHQPA